MNMYKTMHLFVFGCGIGCVLLSFLVKFGYVTSIEASKWYVPLALGLVFLIWEYLVNKR